DLQPGGDFPVEPAAEVAVALEPAADVHQEALANLTFDAAVGAHTVAAAVEGVGGLEAREHLGARFLRLASGRRVEIDAPPAAAVAQLPGCVLAGRDVVLLTSELAARHERERAEPALGTQRPHQIEVADSLAEREDTRVEGRRARRAHRGVVRMLHEVMEGVGAVRDAEVHVPAVERAAYTSGARVVVEDGADLGERPERVARGSGARFVTGQTVGAARRAVR